MTSDSSTLAPSPSALPVPHEIEFVVPLECVAYQRPGRGFGRTFLPQASAEFRRQFRAITTKYLPPHPLKGPLSLHLTIGLVKPKSARKRDKHPAKRPDIDNYIKAVMDSMNPGFMGDDNQVVWRGFYEDDAQVVRLNCSKVYSDGGPYILVQLISLEAF